MSEDRLDEVEKQQPAYIQRWIEHAPNPPERGDNIYDVFISYRSTDRAWAMAYWIRKPAKGLIHHSDRGSQYACHEYRKCLDVNGMIPSMSRKGGCWDNSPTERFFRSLKSERLSDSFSQPERRPRLRWSTLSVTTMASACTLPWGINHQWSMKKGYIEMLLNP